MLDWKSHRFSVQCMYTKVNPVSSDMRTPREMTGGEKNRVKVRGRNRAGQKPDRNQQCGLTQAAKNSLGTVSLPGPCPGDGRSNHPGAESRDHTVSKRSLVNIPTSFGTFQSYDKWITQRFLWKTTKSFKWRRNFNQGPTSTGLRWSFVFISSFQKDPWAAISGSRTRILFTACLELDGLQYWKPRWLNEIYWKIDIDTGCMKKLYPADGTNASLVVFYL